MSNTRSKGQRRSNGSGGKSAGKGQGNNSPGNNSGGNQNDRANGGRQGDKGRSNNSRRRKGPRKKQIDPRIFWGDGEQLSELGEAKATITANPSAVVQSLGRPPLSGQQNAAELYFVAVYDRAVNLAAALAAAGNLIEAEELNGDGGH